MNKSWFTCKVRYMRVDASGNEGKVTESYVLDAYNYTEAETRMMHIMDEMGGAGGYEVMQITKSNFQEVFRHEDADLWFKAKVSFVSMDEESGKEKSANQYFLLSATDVRDCYDKIVEFMKGSISHFVIPSISYTKILEVYPYSEDERNRQELIAQGYTPIPSAQAASSAHEDEDEDEEVVGIDQETGEILD
jgi:hypothetical protein